MQGHEHQPLSHEYIVNVFLFLECACISTSEEVDAHAHTGGSVFVCLLKRESVYVCASVCTCSRQLGEGACALVLKIAHYPWQCVELGLQRFTAAQ